MNIRDFLTLVKAMDEQHVRECLDYLIVIRDRDGDLYKVHNIDIDHQRKAFLLNVDIIPPDLRDL